MVGRGATKNRRCRRWLVRGWRWLRGAVVLAVVLVLLGGVLLTLAPVRGRLLGVAVRLADAWLPGSLETGELAWPEFGQLRIGDLVWRTESPTSRAAYGDTVLQIRRLVVDLDLAALRKHDLLVDLVDVDVVRLDLPELTAMLTPDSLATGEETAQGTGGVPWLRPGGAVDIPSIALPDIRLAIERAVVAPDVMIERVQTMARLDAAHGTTIPRLHLQGGGKVDGGREKPWLADIPTFAVDIRYGPVRGAADIDTCDVQVVAADPEFGQLRIGDLVWRTESPTLQAAYGDTVLQIRRLVVNLDLAALREHDLLVDLVDVDVVRLDLPELTAMLAPDSLATGEESAQGTGGVPWLRPGGAADIPSIALPDIRVAIERAVVAPDVKIERVQTMAGLDAAHGTTVPRLHLQGGGRVDGGGETPWLADIPAFAVDIRYGPVPGEVVIDTFYVQMAAAGPASWEANWRGAAPATLRVTGTAQVNSTSIVLNCRGNLTAPFVAIAADRWPSAMPSEQYTEITAGFLVDATGARPGGIQGRIELDLGGSPGWGRSRVIATGSFDPERLATTDIRLDTLAVELPGLALGGTGWIRGDNFEVAVLADLTSPMPLLALAGPELADADVGVNLAVEAYGTRHDPRGRLDLRGRYETGRLAVPRLRFHAERDSGRTVAMLDVGAVITDGLTRVDSLSIDGQYVPARDLPLRVALSVHRTKERLDLAIAAALDTLITVRLDSLRLSTAGQNIHLAAPAEVRLDTLNRTIELDRIALVGDPGTVHVEGTVSDQEVHLDAGVNLHFDEEMLQNLVPTGLWSADGGVDLVVKGSLLLAGPRIDPDLDGEVTAILQPHRDRPDLGANLRFSLDRGDTNGLAASFSVTSDDTVLFHGRGFLPGRADLTTDAWRDAWGRDLVLDLPEQELPLERFAPLLPEEIGADGTVTFGTLLRWPLRTMADSSAADTGEVSGVLRTSRIHLSLPNRSRAEIVADCRLAGSPLDPRLEGTVTIESAFLRIPKIQRSLHDVEGPALLWDSARTDSTAMALAMDAATALDWQAGADEKPRAPFLPDLDVHVVLPGNLRIHGYGLDTELAGEVDVRRGHDDKGVPGVALTGAVQTVHGTLKFMSRVFEIQRGEVVFTGAVPANPELTLLLAANVSGTQIKIRISGRADDPVIGMSSDPDMNEADIMAFLIFGRPLNDLDGDESGRMGDEKKPNQQLRENMAALAFAFGTQGLQRSVTRTLGVDMMELGSDSEGGSTLAAGKFISPQILLKYHQSLEKSGTYFMTLEYFLSRMFRVVSTYGQGEEESGLEFKWLLRY